MAADDWLAENSFTGIETNPKEMVPDAMDRALMGPDDNLPPEMANFLDEYRRKRSPDRTPEPFGGGAARPGIFVVQKHSATRMHYDLRLEWGGVLKSWAVPRGPSPDPAEKRLAMHTEDHPAEYADFEGVIPAGEYGAGPMIVWDRGQWVPVGDPGEGERAGKILFELKGFKLKGMWTLVRIAKGSGKEWLLIKETGDGYVRRGESFPYDDHSILSGLEVEELHDRGKRAAAIRAECERLGASRREVRGEDVEPMLAEPRRDPFDDPAWLFELKYDGFRAVVAREGSRPRVFYRRGSDATSVFPDLARALRRRSFPIWRARCSRFRRIDLSPTARSRCWTKPGGRVSSGCRSARCSPRRGTSSAQRPSCRRRSSSSICSPSKSSTCARCRWSSVNDSCRGWFRRLDPSVWWITWKAAVALCLPACASWGWKASSPNARNRRTAAGVFATGRRSASIALAISRWSVSARAKDRAPDSARCTSRSRATASSFTWEKSAAGSARRK
ncbi:MAG: hypothetical protein E6J88_10005 [Deltaproteobacteria bacterium]|nr:MAG: hypothetical protein E6J88_10005 [Deltaproteobacteria bacterium]